ncbi:MAG: hypothetical protein ACOC9T_00160 [Myxococcota bacterium]
MLQSLLSDVQAEGGALEELLQSMRDSTEEVTMKKPERKTVLERQLVSIRPVILVEDLEVVEEAVKLTELMNRGDAIVAICRAYVERFREQAR